MSVCFGLTTLVGAGRRGEEYNKIFGHVHTKKIKTIKEEFNYDDRENDKEGNVRGN